ncbi:kynurenine--oxoglutarate transaminase 3-like isoform X2 [Photinus pyralis]|uniref:Aminotransferase class I/classII large domain-containing protein n=2 Tax=Photinus pyralis TaxID=7054 RepID=A0A1Y1L1D5_PHOPY|nr:kynurenine--oxoglutarate transaminase 3-like isoform X2 [Photinus pyralis]XP_031335079.1 kynurenine--oxoglutarate transaminase 3-like isoform X2 [Photinus pyralis]
MDVNEKFKLVLPYVKVNVWEDYAELATTYNPVNLGMGYPDFLPPHHIIDALTEVLSSEDVMLQQYTRAEGHPRLVKALAKMYSPSVNRFIDPLEEIITFAGAFGALYCTIMGHIQQGDEVIIIEPFFDCYQSMVIAAGGTPKYIPLRFQDGDATQSSDWVLDFKELDGLFNSKTKAFILNTPHNPFGKVFNKTELLYIAHLCQKWNVMCIADEVYEWLVYEPKRHIKMASLPGMWERTISIGSAGKTHCITGLKVGWAIGPKHLLINLQSGPKLPSSPFAQEAIAIGIEKDLARFGQDDCFQQLLRKSLKLKTDYMVEVLREIVMEPIVPDAGIFLVADWASLEAKVDFSSETGTCKDLQFTKWFIKNVGVQMIPVSIFYSDANKGLGQNLKDECLQKAANVFREWKTRKSV